MLIIVSIFGIKERTPFVKYEQRNTLSANIDLRLFATLQKFNPPSPGTYPITPGTTVKELLRQLGVPLEKAKLIFVNGLKKDLDARLEGGERVGIFPPVGGG